MTSILNCIWQKWSFAPKSQWPDYLSMCIITKGGTSDFWVDHSEQRGTSGCVSQKKNTVSWADTWGMKSGQAFIGNHTLDRFPRPCIAQTTLAEAHSELCTFPKTHLVNSRAHLQNCYTHYAHSCRGPKLLACAGSSVFPGPSIRSNTEETGPRYQWKCLTYYIVAKERNFMGINLERILHHFFGFNISHESFPFYDLSTKTQRGKKVRKIIFWVFLNCPVSFLKPSLIIKT